MPQTDKRQAKKKMLIYLDPDLKRQFKSTCAEDEISQQDQVVKLIDDHVIARARAKVSLWNQPMDPKRAFDIAKKARDHPRGNPRRSNPCRQWR